MLGILRIDYAFKMNIYVVVYSIVVFTFTACGCKIGSNTTQIYVMYHFFMLKKLVGR